MTERYTLSHSEIEDIRKMPDWVGELAEKYPVEIVNASEVWEDKEFPRNYIPQCIEVYYGVSMNSDGPHIFIYQGNVKTFLVKESSKQSMSIMVDIDGKCAYLEVEGREVVNKLGGVILPEVIVNPSLLIS